MRIPNFPIFLCTSVKPICQIYAKWIKFLSCEFIVYFTHWIFLKNRKDKCALFSQSFFKLITNVRSCLLFFSHRLEVWRMSKKEKVYFVFLSQFWENNCTKLWQILANFKSFKPAHQLSSENKTLQELPILPFTKILGQSNVNNVFLLVVPFTLLVSLVYAVSLVIFFVSVVVSIVFVYFLYFIILESLLSRVSLPCL